MSIRNSKNVRDSVNSEVSHDCVMSVCCSFNLIAFSRSCNSWQTGLVESTEENCHDAAQWITGLVADGNTCTLEALQVLAY